MNAPDHIIKKQQLWAQSRGIELIGSKPPLGRKAYAKTLEENLFEPLEPATRQSIEHGDGNELAGYPCKMQALHSSSALGVNVFEYWQKIGQMPTIAAACGFCETESQVSERIVFEDKYMIDTRLVTAPNIDVVIHNNGDSNEKLFAVECKFSEAYGGRGHAGFKPKYFDSLIDQEALWGTIPNLHAIALSMCPDDAQFEYLHVSQLIKHILGLKKAVGEGKYKLMYLWYDVPGEPGAKHKAEIEIFKEAALSDGVKFHTMSYQELIANMSNELSPEHSEYIKYLGTRYL
ncbi:MAG: hypothetical protein WC880_04960 [Candidatus Paceibacterota bacterium]